MADFSNTTARRASVYDAYGLIDRVRSVYAAAKGVQELLTRYQANSDTPFNAAVNTIYNAEQRQELAQMLQQIDVLVTNWETNHTSVIGG